MSGWPGYLFTLVVPVLVLGAGAEPTAPLLLVLWCCAATGPLLGTGAGADAGAAARCAGHFGRVQQQSRLA